MVTTFSYSFSSDMKLFLLCLKVGLALVVNGKVAVGVMGCPNWTNGTTTNKNEENLDPCPAMASLWCLM